MHSIRRSFPRVAPLAAAIALVALADSRPVHADAVGAAERYRLRLDQREARAHGRVAPRAATVPQGAQTWVVTSCADDGSPGTLRAALEAAGAQRAQAAPAEALAREASR